MNVLIIGANGQIGQMITEKMHESADFTPTAFVRKKEQRADFEHRGVAAVLASLEGSVSEIESTLDGIDAIIFTAGSGGKTGPDKTLTVDLDGAVKAMEAAVNKGVKRFVMVSALRAGDRQAWDASPIKPYFVAKHYADRLLMDMELDYTILRPGRLFDTRGTGKIDVDNPSSQRGVPREDVATLAVEVLRHDNTIGKVIEFNEGNEAILEVVSNM